MSGAAVLQVIRASALSRLLIAVLAMVGGAIPNPSQAAARYKDLRQLQPVQGDAAAGAKKAAVCGACHGTNGAPIAPTFPRLSGQQIEYLYHRLQSFRDADPKDPYYSQSAMTTYAAKLSDQDMRDLAAYFSAQPPTPSPSPTTPTSARGESLFGYGDPSRGIPPCAGCHGADATGPSSRTGQYAAWPSLRAQSAPYLQARLTSYQKGLPADTSNTFIMANVARTLDADSIESISTWLGSLSPK